MAILYGLYGGDCIGFRSYVGFRAESSVLDSRKKRPIIAPSKLPRRLPGTTAELLLDEIWGFPKIRGTFCGSPQKGSECFGFYIRRLPYGGWHQRAY